MEFLEILKAIFLGIVEGITEWLPISSTGHMILVDEFIHLNVSEAFMNVFLYVIQLGAIIAVVVMFFHKLNPFAFKSKTKQERSDTWQMWFKVVVACIPSAVIGLLLNDIMDKYLMNYVVVALMLIVYGVLFLVIERRPRTPKINTLNDLTYKTAFLIGLFQVLSIIPGTSRSGATILGAMIIGCSRAISAEFTFFLAIPTMVGVSILKIGSYGLDQYQAGLPLFTGSELAILLVGMVTAFIVSLFAIKFLMNFIKKHDFKPFGYYRIVLGAVVLVYFLIKTIVAA